MSTLFSHTKKSTLPAYITAKEYVRYTANGISLPKKAVLCPITPLLVKHLSGLAGVKKYWCLADIYVHKDICYVTNFGTGAMAVASAVEVLIALGVKEILFMGLGGSLQEEVLAGDIVLCQESVCADGVSPYYTSQEICPANQGLLKDWKDRLKAQKISFHTGRNWTTPAFFRETKPEIKHYQKKHVLTVDMEVSAVYSVCKKRKVKAAAALVVSDELFTKKWNPQLKNRLVFNTLKQLLKL
jgi:purine-nucleoside phosphorylase